jgi:hypothetical protein
MLVSLQLIIALLRGREVLSQPMVIDPEVMAVAAAEPRLFAVRPTNRSKLRNARHMFQNIRQLGGSQLSGDVEQCRLWDSYVTTGGLDAIVHPKKQALE